jgi:hypothetical protein
MRRMRIRERGAGTKTGFPSLLFSSNPVLYQWNVFFIL